MKEINGFYNKVGVFETFVGDLVVVNKNLILPIFNCQLINHPLCEKLEGIYYLDYCYYIFRDVSKSTRDVYDNFSNFKFSQTNYINSFYAKERLDDFLLELIDFNGINQFWNWIITARSFSIIVEDNYRLSKSQFSLNELSTDFFEKDTYDYLIKKNEINIR